MFTKELSSYDNVFACNFDTAFLPYPLYDMHGKSYAGLSTFSKYQINSAERVEYTISDSLSKLFDIDRYNRLVVERQGDELIYQAILDTDEEYSSTQVDEIMKTHKKSRAINDYSVFYITSRIGFLCSSALVIS